MALVARDFRWRQPTPQALGRWETSQHIFYYALLQNMKKAPIFSWKCDVLVGQAGLENYNMHFILQKPDVFVDPPRRFQISPCGGFDVIVQQRDLH